MNMSREHTCWRFYMCHRWTSARFAVDFDFLGEAFGPDQHGGVATSQHVLQKH